MAKSGTLCGNLLCSHILELPGIPPKNDVVKSLALDADWVIIGLANSCTVQVYSTATGALIHSLAGHDLGVWSVCLVSKGGVRVGGKSKPCPRACSSDVDQELSLPASLRTALGLDLEEADGISDDNSSSPDYAFSRPPGSPSLWKPQREEGAEDAWAASWRESGQRRFSDMRNSSQGWGQPNPTIVSGACDTLVMVWDVLTGQRIYTLTGHTSTVRCIRVLENRPIAISGSHDAMLRVWDIQRGECLRVLEGHTSKICSLDVCGNRVVSGSFDLTCRIWDVDTGECLHVLNGHCQGVWSVAFDGRHVASGGADTTVRLWDANTGNPPRPYRDSSANSAFA